MPSNKIAPYPGSSCLIIGSIHKPWGYLNWYEIFWHFDTFGSLQRLLLERERLRRLKRFLRFQMLLNYQKNLVTPYCPVFPHIEVEKSIFTIFITLAYPYAVESMIKC